MAPHSGIDGFSPRANKSCLSAGSSSITLHSASKRPHFIIIIIAEIFDLARSRNKSVVFLSSDDDDDSSELSEQTRKYAARIDCLWRRNDFW